ncbi:MAG: lipocalin family protein [Chromatiaceae bacterium]
MAIVTQFDLKRIMGDWYVIAKIPTLFEKGAHNAVESYARNPDRTVATSFRFRKDVFDGPEKV